MSAASICPCDGFEHPRTIRNDAGLASVLYRAGDFRSFRRALLQPRPGERALATWRPMPHGDLALQILEWWAYIADILTLYNERSLNGTLLATASLDADVRGLVRILGYRPRPGIGGSAIVAALLRGPLGIELPAGFQIESKPAPGRQPQTFETSKPVLLSMPDAVPAIVPGQLAGGGNRLYLDGTVTSIQPDDLLVLAPQVGFSGAVLITVQSIAHLADTSGRTYTEIVPSGKPALPAADAAGYRLLRSGRASGLWKYPTTTNIVSSPLELEGVERGIGAGQIVVLTAPGTKLQPKLLNVTGTTEQVWYANGVDEVTPPALPAIAIGLPHTRVSYSNAWAGATGKKKKAVSPSLQWSNEREKVRVLIDWRLAGVLRNAPIATYAGMPVTLIAAKGSAFRTGAEQTVVIEDADGAGVRATASVASATPSLMTISSFATSPPPTLKTPLRVLHNVIDLTRGKSVGTELLGAGDASVAFQEFVLKKSPLTYLPAGDSYKSTLALYVNGVQWTEVSSFYGQAPNAQVFITYEDAEQKTHVMGADGVNGARFPTGAAILASYRVESGLEAPGAGALTTILKPFPGLRAVRYPVAGGGGGDPDPRDSIRRYAPRSVLTFGRAISADDYEAIAAGAPSVTRVRAYYAWNAAEQRATATLYVGDTAAAVTSARDALLTSADPNRAVNVQAATAVSAELTLGIRVQPGYIVTDVVEAVRAALADAETGLFGARRTRIGDSIYFSQISEACAKVAGVDALTSAQFELSRPDPQTGSLVGVSPRINADPGEFFVVTPESIVISAEILGSV